MSARPLPLPPDGQVIMIFTPCSAGAKLEAQASSFHALSHVMEGFDKTGHWTFVFPGHPFLIHEICQQYGYPKNDAGKYAYMPLHAYICKGWSRYEHLPTWRNWVSDPTSIPAPIVPSHAHAEVHAHHLGRSRTVGDQLETKELFVQSNLIHVHTCSIFCFCSKATLNLSNNLEQQIWLLKQVDCKLRRAPFLCLCQSPSCPSGKCMCLKICNFKSKVKLKRLGPLSPDLILRHIMRVSRQSKLQLTTMNILNTFRNSELEFSEFNS